jgi:CheY-like chemotaxis protein
MANALKVLIVDDDKSSSHMMSEAVKRLGFKPVVANKASDALNIVRLQTVHAAVVDVLLPKMTGVELVQEFRSTRFADNPVVFVSGVFKDKSFTSEALKKTNGHSFLCKPFSIEEFDQALKDAMQNMVVEKWSVQSLLTRRLNSDRERAKAVENLEQIRGLDFPFVLSILMEVGSSGALNIVNEAGEIFGVSLIEGTVSEVDSADSQATAILSLISKGYLSQDDLDNVQKEGGKRLTLDRLLREGYVSPHAISEAKKDQIMTELKTICSAKTLQVNFVPNDEVDARPRHAVNLDALMEMVIGSIEEFFAMEYLEDFYRTMLHSPIRLVHLSQAVAAIWDRPSFRNLKLLKSTIEKGETLENALKVDGVLKQQTYQCLHYLVLVRAVMFEDVNRTKNLTSQLEQYKLLYDQLKGKTPDKVFEYFGAKSNSSATLLKNIWNEFLHSNDPKALGPEATDEIRQLCQKCYDLVSAAKDVMLDEGKRAQLQLKIDEETANRQKQSTLLVTEAFDLLRKGVAKDALEKLRKAEKLFVNNRWHLMKMWAEVKMAGPDLKSTIPEFLKRLDSYASEERKNPLYYFVFGLVKRVSGDPTATASFEKALQIDPEFMEAKRELKAGAGKGKKDEKVNLFTGDLSDVVSQLFRRKPD